MTTEAISCFGRIRPKNQRELSLNAGNCLVTDDNHTIYVIQKEKSKDAHRAFGLDHVFAEDSTQETVFSLAGIPLIESCQAGFNSTL